MKIQHMDTFMAWDRKDKVTEVFLRALVNEMIEDAPANHKQPVTNALFIDTDTGAIKEVWQSICFASVGGKWGPKNHMINLFPHNLTRLTPAQVAQYASIILDPLTSPWRCILPKLHVTYDLEHTNVPLAITCVDNSINTQVFINLLTALRHTYEMPAKIEACLHFMDKGVIGSIALYLGQCFTPDKYNMSTFHQYLGHQPVDSIRTTSFDVARWVNGMPCYDKKLTVANKSYFTPCNDIFNNGVYTFKLEDINKIPDEGQAPEGVKEIEYFFDLAYRKAGARNRPVHQGYDGTQYNTDKLIKAYTAYAQRNYDVNIMMEVQA